MGFGQRLKELRKDNRMTQEELGKIINVSKVSISGYENGTRSPDRETLVNIADYFNVSVDYLLDREKSPDWASTDDLLKLEDMLASNKPMAYNGIELNEEDKERINAVLTQVFWERLKKQKDKKQ